MSFLVEKGEGSYVRALQGTCLTVKQPTTKALVPVGPEKQIGIWQNHQGLPLILPLISLPGSAYKLFYTVSFSEMLLAL